MLQTSLCLIKQKTFGVKIEYNSRNHPAIPLGFLEIFSNKYVDDRLCLSTFYHKYIAIMVL